MVLYFSGTGNSRYVAMKVAMLTGDVTLSLGDLLRRGETALPHGGAPYVIVCPTYAWRIPAPVEALLRAMPLTPGTPTWFILTCGSSIMNAAGYARRLCEDKGLVFMGLSGIVMPENYIALFPVPDKGAAAAIVSRAEAPIHALAARIAAGQPFASRRASPLARLVSAAAPPLFNRFVISAKAFYATEACTRCGKCAALCPTRTIAITDAGPCWGKGCMHCMACISLCPKQAIEYGNASVGKPRHHLAPPDTGDAFSSSTI